MTQPSKMDSGIVLRRIQAALKADEFRFSDHAYKRLNTREVTVLEALQALRTGQRKPAWDRLKYGAWSYGILGETIDNRLIRLGVRIDGVVVIVTLIALGKKK